MDNLAVYENVRSVPATALREIKGGRLKGMTDISPMWRIKTLTEQFGMCGVGWKAPIISKEIFDGSNGEKIAVVDINLFVKVNGEWSEPIPGTGGSMLIAKEKDGLHTSDECFKMAYTDALSVACKMLGMGADIYWEKDATKYSANNDKPDNVNNTPDNKVLCKVCEKPIRPVTYANGKKLSPEEFADKSGGRCYECYQKAVERQKQLDKNKEA